MVDSIRVIEIHRALEADKYSKYISTANGNEVARTANIGHYVERIALALGINILADGTTYRPPSTSVVETVDTDPDTLSVTVPPPYRKSHWGLQTMTVSDSMLIDDGLINTGVPTTDAPREVMYQGMWYEIVSNKFIENPSTGELDSIGSGGLALIHNIPQLIRVIMDDLDKGLGLQESGAFAIRSAEDINSDNPTTVVNEFRPKICTYEGLNSLVIENSIMLSEISRRVSQAQISSLKTEAKVNGLMRITGLPSEPHYFEASVGKETADGKDIQQKIYYIGFANDSPTLFDLWVTSQNNIGIIIGSLLKPDTETTEQIKELSDDDYNQFLQDLMSNFSSQVNQENQ